MGVGDHDLTRVMVVGVGPQTSQTVTTVVQSRGLVEGIGVSFAVGQRVVVYAEVMVVSPVEQITKSLSVFLSILLHKVVGLWWRNVKRGSRRILGLGSPR